MESDTVQRWYVIKVHSGFERPVVAALNQAKDSLGLGEEIVEVIIPTEKKIRLKDGRRIEREERIFPGAILVRMLLNDKTWYAINNIEHVSGFYGSRTHAETLSDEEVEDIKKRMNSDNTRQDSDVSVGSSVQIIEGLFKNQEGTIKEMDIQSGKATVLISMQGTPIKLKLDLFQIRAV